MPKLLGQAVRYPNFSSKAKSKIEPNPSSTALIHLTEVGEYTVKATVGGKEISYKIFSGASPEESKPVSAEDEFFLSGEMTYENIDGTYDPTLILFILILVLFIADWGVYCYEKYQLR